MKTKNVEMVSLETLLAESATAFEARLKAAHKVTVDARDTTATEKGSLKALGKFYYACKARLQRLKDMDLASATETDIDYIRRVTGDESKKPINTHASTLAKGFGELVIFTGAITESTYDRAKQDWIEAMVPIYDEVKKSLKDTPADQLKAALLQHDSLTEAVEIVTSALTDTERAKTAKKELVALLREIRPKTMPAWEDIEDKVREWLSHPALTVAIQNEIAANAAYWTNGEFGAQFHDQLRITHDNLAKSPLAIAERAKQGTPAVSASPLPASVPAPAPAEPAPAENPQSAIPIPQSEAPDYREWATAAFAGLLDDAGLADVVPLVEAFHTEYGELPADADALNQYADKLAVAA
jgi:hypothetical protein